MAEQYYVVGHNSKKGIKAIITPNHLTIWQLFERFLLQGIVLQNVTKEEYDAFNTEDVSILHLGSTIINDEEVING